jgi:uncharacterized protein (TIGR02594 family)
METRELIWLELMKYHGLSEVSGPGSNSVIMSWFEEFGAEWVKDDSETAWCSLTINKVAKDCHLHYSGKLDARSWLKIGTKVNTVDVKIGHIVVFYREAMSGWKGHVGLFAGWSKDKSKIYTLGGNQGNQIGIKAYPVNTPEFGVLGFREL